MRKLAKCVAIAGFSAMAGLISVPSQGATVLSSGSTFDGWLITPVSGVALTADDSSSTNLAMTKAANFSNMEGLVISFTQVAPSAASTITFLNETLTNNTGTTWGGFQFLLMNPNASAAFVNSGASPFTPATGYTSGTFASDSVVYAGAQANTATSQWGFDSNGDLVITSNPGALGTTFDLKEIPLTADQLPGAGAGGIPIGIPGVAVPLPTAGAQGLVGLITLSLISCARKVAKRVVVA